MTTENLWSFDKVRVGQSGPESTVAITADDIAMYASVSQDPEPAYQAAGASAMPTMLLSYAPLFREQIAAANGLLAYELSETDRRQTPFTRCECRWQRPVFAGDVITASRAVQETYTRRGSNFVVFRVAARNQDGDPVGEYDYTCIFDYVRQPAGTAARPMPRAQTEGGVAFTSRDAIAPGQRLQPIRVTETQETMDAKDAFRLIGERGVGSNIHTDEEFARKNIFGTTVNSGPATMAYAAQLIENNLGPGCLGRGGRLLLRAIKPFRGNDTVTFSGTISAIDANDGISVEVRGINQSGELVCLADAQVMP